MKTIREITLNECMQEDLFLWGEKNETFGFDLYIENKEGEIIAKEKGVNPLHMESMIDMFGRFLNFHQILEYQYGE